MGFRSGGVGALFEHARVDASFLEGGTEHDIYAWHGCEAHQLPLVAESAPELPAVVGRQQLVLAVEAAA